MISITTTKEEQHPLHQRILENELSSIIPITLHLPLAKEFFGYIEGGYGAQVVRLVDVPFTQSEIEVRGNKEGFVAAIVRANDTGTKDYTKDISYSATEVNNLVLPALAFQWQYDLWSW